MEKQITNHLGTTTEGQKAETFAKATRQMSDKITESDCCEEVKFVSVNADFRDSLKEVGQLREDLGESGRRIMETRAKFSKEVALIQSISLNEKREEPDKEIFENDCGTLEAKPSMENIASRLREETTDIGEVNEKGKPFGKPSEDSCRGKTAEKEDNNIDLHLSKVKIMKWTVPKPKDAEAMEKVKQVCGALDGDDIYHYENIDDFDDTYGEYQRVLRKGKVKYIHCRYFIDENGVCTSSRFCKGKRKRKRFDLEWYILGEIAKGCDTISCCKKGCPNIYDPWDIVCLHGTKDIHFWYETVAFDPFKNKAKIYNIKQVLKTSKKVAPETDESTPKESDPTETTDDKQVKKKWWQKKKINAKQNNQSSEKTESKQTSEEVNPYNTDEDSEAKQYKYECETCLSGFDKDPRKETATCEHYNCKSCLKQYFNNQVTNLITKIECPRPDCHRQFSSKFIINLLNHNLRFTYARLYSLRLELEKNDKEETKLLEKVCKKGPDCTGEKCLCKEPEDPEWWIERSKRFTHCPKCRTVIEKMNDGGCNFVVCSICKSEFCWVCKKICVENLHVFQCPMYGNKNYSKARVVVNYLACGAGVSIGGPLIGGIILGGSVAFFGTVITAGTFSPPYYLAKKSYNYHKKQNSSALKRNLSTIGAASLGLIGMPILSLWGIGKTINIACKSTYKSIDQWLDEPEPEKQLPAEYRETVNGITNKTMGEKSLKDTKNQKNNKGTSSKALPKSRKSPGETESQKPTYTKFENAENDTEDQSSNGRRKRGRKRKLSEIEYSKSAIA